MRTVWKYTVPFPPNDVFELPVPAGAEPVKLDLQHGVLCLWMLIPNSKAEREFRQFAVVGTGHKAPEDADYVDSFQFLDGDFVGHLFARRLA